MANLLSWMLHSVQHDGLECVPLLPDVQWLSNRIKKRVPLNATL